MTRPEDSPIVVFGDDWGRRVSSMQHVFREIVERRRVIWINGIGHRVPTLRFGDLRRVWEKARSMVAKAPIAEIDGTFDDRSPEQILQPHVLPWHHWHTIAALNRRSLLRAIREALTALDISAPPVLVTGSPPSTVVLGRMGEAASVYFCMDDFLHLAGVTAEMLGPLERRLLRRVDAVVATAESLTRTKVPRTGVVHYIPQGVNYEHFAAPRPEPAELAKLPRPVIGFAGGVSDCCDLDLIRKIADAHPDASVVLVGPIGASDLSPIRRPNIHLLGPRPYRDLPAYVQAFDVGLIPYLLNDWTVAVDPLKLLEYLAAGLPVVSTDIPEVRKYGDAIRIAATHEAYLAELDKALRTDPAAARERGQYVARQHSWAQRADTFLDIMDQLVEQKLRTRAMAVS